MLKKFNELFNKVIFEATEDNDNTDRFIKEINDCDAFFHAYIENLANKLNIEANKVRYNVFRLYGDYAKILDFLTTFKVDKKFLQDTTKFEILNPLVCFCNYKHKYNLGGPHFYQVHGSEGQTLFTTANEINHKTIDTPNTNEMFQNKEEFYIYGRWYDLFTQEEINSEIPLKVKKDTPKNIQKLLNKFFKYHKFDKVSKDELPKVYFEFSVNCDCLPNNSYEELSQAVPMLNDQTLSDQINNRISQKPQPNENVLGTINTSIEPEVNKEVKKNLKNLNKSVKTTDFNNKNKVKNKRK